MGDNSETKIPPEVHKLIRLVCKLGFACGPLIKYAWCSPAKTDKGKLIDIDFQIEFEHLTDADNVRKISARAVPGKRKHNESQKRLVFVELSLTITTLHGYEVVYISDDHYLQKGLEPPTKYGWGDKTPDIPQPRWARELTGLIRILQREVPGINISIIDLGG